MRFNKGYFLLTLLILFVEIFIALFVKDGFVRPYVGDVLVVMLIYCAVQTIFRIHVWRLASGVLLFSFLIEFMQYLKIVNHLGLGSSAIARTVIGTSFSWIDMLAYVIGITIVIFSEWQLAAGSRSSMDRRT